MDLNELKQFTKALKLVSEKDLAGALDIMVSYVDTHPYVLYTEEIKDINENYNLMLHYMELGVEDRQRQSMYESMLSKLKSAIRNIRTDYRRRNVDFYKDAYNHSSINSFSYSWQEIKLKLEDFVSDLAMLQLEPQDKRQKMEDNLYSGHFSYMQSLFCYIVVSDLWMEEYAKCIGDIILSPTIDTFDAQIIVSAIMLSAMNNFDIYKFRTLTRVYSEASDEALRQKALIGWVLSMTGRTDFDLQEMELRRVCADEMVAKELLDLQKQMIYCMNAEKDNAVIQRDIMPTLIRNSNMASSRFGVEDKELELRNILEPDAEDKAIEEVEDKFQKMVEMQRGGADIYFGGFSHMKRFPFFYTLPNWFFPFSFNHPDLQKVREKIKNNKFLDSLMCSGPFCDSDKYSFSFAVVSVLDKIPSDMLEVMSNGEVPKMEDTESRTKTPAYLRRKILQDLYRFFRLYRWHNQIYDPFVKENVLFLTNPLFVKTKVNGKLLKLGSFLLSHGEMEYLSKLIPELAGDHSSKANMLKGTYCLEVSKQYSDAARCFSEVLHGAPDNIRAMEGLAKSAFVSGDWALARSQYEHLCSLLPDDMTIALDYSMACTKTNDYDEAARILFELDFKYPDTKNVKRVLAWALMGQKKLSQASKIYDWLLDTGKTGRMDFLNAGYCKWFQGDISSATTLFSKYCNAVATLKGDKQNFDYDALSKALDAEFRDDAQMIDSFGISVVDRMLVKRITYNKNRISK